MGPNTPQKFSAAKLFGFGGGSNETKKGKTFLDLRRDHGLAICVYTQNQNYFIKLFLKLL